MYKIILLVSFCSFLSLSYSQYSGPYNSGYYSNNLQPYSYSQNWPNTYSSYYSGYYPYSNNLQSSSYAQNGANYYPAYYNSYSPYVNNMQSSSSSYSQNWPMGYSSGYHMQPTQYVQPGRYSDSKINGYDRLSDYLYYYVKWVCEVTGHRNAAAIFNAMPFFTKFLMAPLIWFIQITKAISNVFDWGNWSAKLAKNLTFGY